MNGASQRIAAFREFVERTLSIERGHEVALIGDDDPIPAYRGEIKGPLVLMERVGPYRGGHGGGKISAQGFH